MSDLISKTKVLEIIQEKIEGFKGTMNLYKDPRSIDNPPRGQFAESIIRDYYNLEDRIKEYQNLKKEINNIGNETITLNSLFKPVDEKTPINEDIPF